MKNKKVSELNKKNSVEFSIGFTESFDKGLDRQALRALKDRIMTFALELQECSEKNGDSREIMEKYGKSLSAMKQNEAFSFGKRNGELRAIAVKIEKKEKDGKVVKMLMFCWSGSHEDYNNQVDKIHIIKTKISSVNNQYQNNLLKKINEIRKVSKNGKNDEFVFNEKPFIP